MRKILFFFIFVVLLLVFVVMDVDAFGSKKECEFVEVTGVLEMRGYPRLDKITPPCIVWILKDGQRIFYLTREGSPLCHLSDQLAAGDRVRISGMSWEKPSWDDKENYQFLEVSELGKL